MNQEKINDLLHKVMDLKYDTQQVLDNISSMDSAYEEQTGREQALEREVADLKERLKMEIAAVERLRKDPPTMPVIPKDVAIAIFREGIKEGVYNVCDELENSDTIEIEDSGYTGGFEVSFSTRIDLSEHLNLDWMRGKVGNYEELNVINALMGLCETKKFECRIHGIDDNPTIND